MSPRAAKSEIQQGMTKAAIIAEKLDLDARALTCVLDCLVTFGLLGKTEEDIYSFTEESATFSSEHGASSRPMLFHINDLWDCWSDLTEVVVKGTGPEEKTSEDYGP